MEMGTFQRVVEYRLVQKMGWLGWRTTTFTIHNTKLMEVVIFQNNESSKEKCPSGLDER
jgi:hypothetical protein